MTRAGDRLGALFGWGVFALWFAWRWRSVLLPLALVAAALALSGCACSVNPQAPECNRWQGVRFDKHWRARPLN